MKVSTNFRLEMNVPAVVARFDPRFQKAQTYLDNEILKDCAPYVPMRTGFLMRSGQNGTVLGSGDIQYNAPYARSCYYALSRNFSKALHPQASAQWFEKAKAVKKQNWVEGVNNVMKGGV